MLFRRQHSNCFLQYDISIGKVIFNALLHIDVWFNSRFAIFFFDVGDENISCYRIIEFCIGQLELLLIGGVVLIAAKGLSDESGSILIFINRSKLTYTGKTISTDQYGYFPIKVIFKRFEFLEIVKITLGEKRERNVQSIS